MIELTRQGKMGRKFFLNPHHIVSIETLPDTTITLLNEQVVVVAEDYPTVFKKIVEYRKLVVGFRNEE